MLEKETRENTGRYQELRREANRICKMKKQKMREQLDETEQSSKQNENIIFEFKTGDGLSATVFIIALHKVIKKINQRGTIFTKLSKVCANAYDEPLTVRTKQKLIQIYQHSETEARRTGLLVNERKTKYTFMSADGNRREQQTLRIGNKEFEGVSEFKYLGNIIEKRNWNDKCTKEGIQTGNKANYTKHSGVVSKITSYAIRNIT